LESGGAFFDRIAPSVIASRTNDAQPRIAVQVSILDIGSQRLIEPSPASIESSTSTPENDKMEYFGIAAVFGARCDGGLPVSSNKSMIGHTLSAAGAVEAAFSVMTLVNGVLPPTINYEIPDPALPLDVVPNEARKAAPEFVLSNSFGFGGQNTSIVFGSAER